MTSFRPILCFLLALLAVCLTAACRSPQEVFLTESDSGRTLDLRVGDTILVALHDDNGTAGYGWYPRHGAGNVQVIAEKGDRFLPDPDSEGSRISAAGRNGTHYYNYRVIGPGVCGIALDYKQNWANKPTSRVFEIMIRATGEPEEAASDPREFPPDEEPVYMTDSKGNVTLRPDMP